ncbi:hypothetical protein [Streptomyces aureus]|uniref:hypothetical protein n=1 Tax=Streptomyces aureus TaxID=193461 RepID=UPI00362975F1
MPTVPEVSRVGSSDVPNASRTWSRDAPESPSAYVAESMSWPRTDGGANAATAMNTGIAVRKACAASRVEESRRLTSTICRVRLVMNGSRSRSSAARPAPHRATLVSLLGGCFVNCRPS